MQQEIKNNIQGSKIYSVICESAVDKLIQREIPKYKKKKDVEQSVRAKLHAWITMFYDNYNKVLKNIDDDNMGDEFFKQLIKTHISTKERFEFLQEFFDDVQNVVGEVGSIIDFGAGFNPIAYFLYTNNKNVEYTAIDAEKNGVEALNLCFKSMGVNGVAFAQDVLDFNIDKKYDVCFMFKLLPLLEQQKRGSALEIVRRVNSHFLCISYPTKTLSGKNVGMYNKYKNDIQTIMQNCDAKLIFEKEYKNEILFILENKKS